MFVVTDCTRKPPYRMNSSDVKDVQDIVLGISGSEEIADAALRHASEMHFGDSYVFSPYFILDCIKENKT